MSIWDFVGDAIDTVTDVAEGAARLTGNDELADAIDEVDDFLEDIGIASDD